MGTNTEVAVRLLGAADGGATADRLADLINRVYVTAESGLWHTGTPRTTAEELTRFIAERQIAVATLGGEVVGSIRVHDASDEACEFGMLVAAPEHRGTGVGLALVAFAEQHARARGRHVMQLELLVPQAWRHPTKEYLTSWYGRLGYRVVGSRSITDTYPHLASLLATPSDLLVFEKELAA